MPANNGKRPPPQDPLIMDASEEHTRLLALSSEVWRALTQNMALKAKLQCCANAVAHCLTGAFARIWTLDDAGDTLELQARAGAYDHLDGPYIRLPIGDLGISLGAKERRPHLLCSAIDDPRVDDKEWAIREGMTAFVEHPLVVSDQVVGVMALFTKLPLPPNTLTALDTIANQIAIGIQSHKNERQLRTQTEVLTALYRVGQSLFAELDLKKVVQTCTDACTELTGAQFGAFFYNVEDERGESHTLYTISGASREAFSQFPIPRNTGIFAPTFTGQGTLRLDDMTKDDRYGKNTPYKGLPEGHLPVRSYLAVPVISRSGKVAGGLFFGHEQAGVFGKRHEVIVEGLAVQTAIALENAHLYRIERERSEQLAQAIQEVHHRVKNSLQGVCALLEMQIPLDSDMMPAKIMWEGLNQIKTIALVYDLLARDQPIGKVDAGIVLTRLGSLLGVSMQTGELREPIRVAAEPVMLPTNAATSLALAVNELISNAVKHRRATAEAVTGSDTAIQVGMTNRAGIIRVTVQDCGPGFPPDFDAKRQANIGLELVLTLVRHDLQGTITFTNAVHPADKTVCGGLVEINFFENLRVG